MNRGDVPKWLKGPDSKSGRRRKACGGSNPSISAKKQTTRPSLVVCFLHKNKESNTCCLSSARSCPHNQEGVRAAFSFPETGAVVTSACSAHRSSVVLVIAFGGPFGYDVITPNGKGTPPYRELETYVHRSPWPFMLRSARPESSWGDWEDRYRQAGEDRVPAAL